MLIVLPDVLHLLNEILERVVLCTDSFVDAIQPLSLTSVRKRASHDAFDLSGVKRVHFGKRIKKRNQICMSKEQTKELLYTLPLLLKVLLRLGLPLQSLHMTLVHTSLQMLLPLVLSDDHLLAHIAFELLVATTS